MTDDTDPSEEYDLTQAFDRLRAATALYRGEDVPLEVFSETDIARRKAVTRRLGYQYGFDRDLYSTLGYEREPDAETFLAKYDRQDIAGAVINLPVEAAWREMPLIQDDPDSEEQTEFEQAVEELFTEKRALHYFERADKVSGIGDYGVLFLGFMDEPPVGEEEPEEGWLSEPVNAGGLPSDPEDALAYLTPFGEWRIEDVQENKDPRDPRFGLPERYKIQFDQEKATGTWVHHTRVIHVADGLLESEWKGRSRLRRILNRLEDLEKTVGGAAEMTWRGADRKFVVNTAPEMGEILDKDKLKQDIEDMIHGLHPVSYTRGTEIDVIGGETVDPTGIADLIMKLIAGDSGIPRRMLTGSERGELASTQDRSTFLGRVAERQTSFCEPVLLRPFIERLVQFEIIPGPRDEEFEVEWIELFELNELETAEVRSKNAASLKAAAPMGDPEMLAAAEEIREQIMDWGPDRGDETSADSLAEDEEPDEEELLGDQDLLDDILDRAPGPENGEQPIPQR